MTDPTPDHVLLVAARGDAATFEQFYRRHARAVLGFFRRRVTGTDVAFDLTAETFARVLAGLDRYDPEPDLARAWLFGIARNVLQESLRSGQVDDQARRALEMQPIRLDADAVDWLEALPAGPALAALADLPAEQRTAVVARHLDERSYEDIARELRCSESVVRQRVSRGLRTLRGRLEEETR